MKKDEIVRTLRQHRTELATELKETDAALAALNGQPVTEAKAKAQKRRRRRTGKRSMQSWKNEVLEFMRQKPQETWTRPDLARRFDIPQTTAAVLVDQLITDGSVDQVDTTSRGTPIIRYRPTEIRVGEGVVGR